MNAGQGYTSVPRISVIDPVGAQVLATTVDSNGRLIGIELLDGGSGYDDIPSVYIVDNRTDASQVIMLGGTGATASAAIFNGRITDINVTHLELDIVKLIHLQLSFRVLLRQKHLPKLV